MTTQRLPVTIARSIEPFLVAATADWDCPLDISVRIGRNGIDVSGLFLDRVIAPDLAERLRLAEDRDLLRWLIDCHPVLSPMATEDAPVSVSFSFRVEEVSAHRRIEARRMLRKVFRAHEEAAMAEPA